MRCKPHSTPPRLLDTQMFMLSPKLPVNDRACDENEDQQRNDDEGGEGDDGACRKTRLIIGHGRSWWSLVCTVTCVCEVPVEVER